jgi:hypothetical protein
MKTHPAVAELFHTDRQTGQQGDRQTDKQTDRHVEANSHYLQFCECLQNGKLSTFKNQIIILNTYSIKKSIIFLT